MKSGMSVLTFILLFCKAVSAQSFIEVSVQDTILFKAGYFLYNFSINNYSYETDMVDTIAIGTKTVNQETAVQRLEREYNSIVLELKKNKFKLVSPGPLDTLNIVPTVIGKSGTIVITNPDSLIIANRVLKKSDKVIAYVVSQGEPTATDEMRLYNKLLEKAKRQAANIAELSGRKINQIESVIQKDEEEKGFTSYPPLSGLASEIPGWHTTIFPQAFESSPNEIYYPAGKTFIVKFSLK